MFFSFLLVSQYKEAEGIIPSASSFLVSTLFCYGLRIVIPFGMV